MPIVVFLSYIVLCIIMYISPRCRGCFFFGVFHPFSFSCRDSSLLARRGNRHTAITVSSSGRWIIVYYTILFLLFGGVRPSPCGATLSHRYRHTNSSPTRKTAVFNANIHVPVWKRPTSPMRRKEGGLNLSPHNNDSGVFYENLVTIRPPARHYNCAFSICRSSTHPRPVALPLTLDDFVYSTTHQHHCLCQSLNSPILRLFRKRGKPCCVMLSVNSNIRVWHRVHRSTFVLIALEKCRSIYIIVELQIVRIQNFPNVCWKYDVTMEQKNPCLDCKSSLYMNNFNAIV